jgi:hypothetical protein
VNNSIGINFKDEWGPKISVNGSYSYTDKRSTIYQNISQENIFQDKSIKNTQKVSNYSDNMNHRFSFNVEYKVDSFNYIKFTPNITYRQSSGDNISDFLFLDPLGNKSNEGNTSSLSDSKAPNISGNILFNHMFKKKGRTFSLNLNAGSNSSKSDEDYVNLSTIYRPTGTRIDSLYQNILQDNTTDNMGVRASYIEPLNKKQSLEFNYAYNNQVTGNDRENYIVNPYTGQKQFDESLSNIFDNTYITNRFGVNFRTNQKKYNYSIGLAVQPATIKSNSITGKYQNKQNIVNYFPLIRYAYNFSRSRSLSFNYNGNTNQPSFSQLQPVTDSSNPQFLVTGNPNLRPEFTNTFSMRYNNFDFISGNVFFGNLTASFVNDKIVNNVFDKGFGSQETKYLNSNGYFTISAFYNISKPIQNRKYVFNLGGNVTYFNNVSYVGNFKNKGENWILGQRFSMDYKLKKWLESNVAFNFSLNNSVYSLQKQLNATTRAYTLSHNSRIFLPKSFILSYDIEKTINDGFGGTVSTNPLIINSTLEKQFFSKKNLTIRLQSLDMLNQNTNVSRNVTASGITDTRTNRLGRYYMATFVFRLNKFKGQSSSERTIITTGGMPMMH